MRSRGTKLEINKFVLEYDLQFQIKCDLLTFCNLSRLPYSSLFVKRPKPIKPKYLFKWITTNRFLNANKLNSFYQRD